MKIWQDEICAWVALYMISGIGNRAFKNLLERFGQPKAVFETAYKDLVSVEGVRKEVARRIVNREFIADPEVEMRNLEKCNARLIRYIDAAYPIFLKEISSSPMLLYIRGKDIPLTQTFIAVVGSRNPTHYGIRAAERISMDLATLGVGVVSGLARGIDSAAHRGCLMGKGFTVGVMGTGIDRVYPSSNRRLAEQIMESGAVISEFPTGSPPEPRNFPIRNRIISGLARGVLVVEATKKSGSLITASMALEQGREVFAVPGSIDSFKSTGSHFLIKQGAKLVENADDILDEFGFNDALIGGNRALKNTRDGGPDLIQSEKAIYELIGDYPMHIDEIVRLGEMDTGEALGVLLQMELKGIVKQLPGKMFVR
jgi:DNA processing protein